jgi:hypothetical protein
MTLFISDLVQFIYFCAMVEGLNRQMKLWSDNLLLYCSFFESVNNLRLFGRGYWTEFVQDKWMIDGIAQYLLLFPFSVPTFRPLECCHMRFKIWTWFTHVSSKKKMARVYKMNGSYAFSKESPFVLAKYLLSPSKTFLHRYIFNTWNQLSLLCVTTDECHSENRILFLIIFFNFHFLGYYPLLENSYPERRSTPSSDWLWRAFFQMFSWDKEILDSLLKMWKFISQLFSLCRDVHHTLPPLFLGLYGHIYR